MSQETVTNQQHFEHVVEPKRRLFDFNLKELWQYRDLIPLLVKRNFISIYKQTILGPAWALIQPFFTTIVFTLVFGNLAGLAPDGVPSFAFYLCGSVAWGYFSGCLNATASTFIGNAALMGKVYFPRLVMPITTVISQLISFGIQFVMFIGFWIYFWATGQLQPNLFALLTPLLILQMAFLGLGFGVIISSLTTKYRDLSFAVGFGMQLWMYGTPVAYDMSIIPESFKAIYMLNPMTPVINTFRYAFLGVGEFNLTYYLISWAVTVVVLFIGILLFNRVEKTFADTV